VPLTGLEPVRDFVPADFKSAVSTYSTTAAEKGRTYANIQTCILSRKRCSNGCNMT
jgi:hypothetical protein